MQINKSILLVIYLICFGILACHPPKEKPISEEDLTVITPSSSLDIRQDFIFQILNKKTKRQGGQKVNIFVKYRYSDELLESQLFPDYRKIRTIALKYVQPSKEFPKNVQWELLSRAMANEIMESYSVKGISIQWQTFPNEMPKKGSLYEPGFHGSIFTIGDIEPLSVTGVNLELIEK